MTRVSGLFAAAVALALFGACSSDSPGDDDTSNPNPPTAGTPDAGQPNTDPPPDPNAADYPPGPYGTTKGSVISNRSWVGYMDTDVDTDDDPFNEPPHKIALSDFYRPKHPDSRLLVMIQSAGWCGPCQDEAAHLPSMAAEWYPQGVRFLTAMLEDQNGSPCDTDFALDWGQTFDLTTAVVADPTGKLDPYYFENGIPFNLFIDTRTMTIVDKMSGWDQSEAESIFAAYTD